MKEEIYKKIDEYFQNTDPKERRPSPWRVPVGGSFYNEKEVKAVLECYLNGWLSVQKRVVEFEKIFADYIGVRHGIATNSGSSANLLALNALMETNELQTGDEVIIPATTFVMVPNPAIKLGLVPVYVDVDASSFNLDPQEFEKAIIPGKTKAVMVVHTLGCPADMDKIMPVARKYGLKVIEDTCEAHGATYKGKKVGGFGDLATFSFYVAHNITTGEGGMVLTNSDAYHELIVELREFGRMKSYEGPRFGYSDDCLTEFDERYIFHRMGYNFRMADPPAAFGIEQVKKLDELNNLRIKNAQFYMDNFGEELRNIFQIPSINEAEIKHTFYAFPLAIKPDVNISRSKITRYLASKGIETRAIFCGTLPDQPCLRKIPSRTSGSLPVSRQLRDRAFFIGCDPGLKQDDLEYVIKTLKEVCL